MPYSAVCCQKLPNTHTRELWNWPQGLESVAKNVELQGNKEKTMADGKEVHRMHSKGGHGPGGSKENHKGGANLNCLGNVTGAGMINI
jgi:hypothetical protein